MSLGPVSRSPALPVSRPVPRPASGPVADTLGPKVARSRADDERALKASAQQMEALFVQQLFQTMRANIPTDGLVERGAGEDLFNSLLDQRIAESVAEKDSGPRDLSASLFEALRNRLGPATDTPR